MIAFRFLTFVGFAGAFVVPRASHCPSVTLDYSPNGWYKPSAFAGSLPSDQKELAGLVSDMQKEMAELNTEIARLRSKSTEKPAVLTVPEASQVSKADILRTNQGLKEELERMQTKLEDLVAEKEALEDANDQDSLENLRRLLQEEKLARENERANHERELEMAQQSNGLIELEQTTKAGEISRLQADLEAAKEARDKECKRAQELERQKACLRKSQKKQIEDLQALLKKEQTTRQQEQHLAKLDRESQMQKTSQLEETVSTLQADVEKQKEQTKKASQKASEDKQKQELQFRAELKTKLTEQEKTLTAEAEQLERKLVSRLNEEKQARNATDNAMALLPIELAYTNMQLYKERKAHAESKQCCAVSTNKMEMKIRSLKSEMNQIQTTHQIEMQGFLEEKEALQGELAALERELEEGTRLIEEAQANSKMLGLEVACLKMNGELDSAPAVGLSSFMEEKTDKLEREISDLRKQLEDTRDSSQQEIKSQKEEKERIERERKDAVETLEAERASRESDFQARLRELESSIEAKVGEDTKSLKVLLREEKVARQDDNKRHLRELQALQRNRTHTAPSGGAMKLSRELTILRNELEREKQEREEERRSAALLMTQVQSRKADREKKEVQDLIKTAVQEQTRPLMTRIQRLEEALSKKSAKLQRTQQKKLASDNLIKSLQTEKKSFRRLGGAAIMLLKERLGKRFTKKRSKQNMLPPHRVVKELTRNDCDDDDILGSM